MKIQSKVFALFACIAISLTLSCSKDQATELQQEENFTKTTDNIERTLIEKVGADKATEIMNQSQNPSRFAITYNGELLPGIVNYGEASYRGYNNLANANFWYFTGNAGDCVSIDVNRVSCEMDPVIIVYSGSGDTTNLTFLAFADDEDVAACAPACFSYGDPSLEGFSLPSSGDYTIAVWDLVGGNCTSGPQSYSIVMTGSICDADEDGCNDEEDPHPDSNQDATVNIDGCDAGVANIFIGCVTMNDLIADCAAAASNHGDFISCVVHLTNDWKAAGLISGIDKGNIRSCAANSNVP